MKAYRIGLEPEGEVYAGLLTAALKACQSGLLVVRDTIELAPSGVAIVRRLQPFMLRETRASQWPGTRLFESEATIYHFALSAQSIGVLRQAANALYEWQQPERPEDLTFFRPDERPWLISIAHEGEAFIVATERELEAIQREVPGLGPFIPEELDRE